MGKPRDCETTLKVRRHSTALFVFLLLGYYCDADSYRIKNALALMMFARGIPIVYYGTEQGLDGHQANVLEKDAMRKQGVEDKGQAFVRESLWQTRYNTSTWKLGERFFSTLPSYFLNHWRKS